VGWSLFYIGVAVAFGVVFGVIEGWDLGGQYFADYIVEKSLSVDNLFVCVIIMATFSVPSRHQRVLTFGILAALVLRVVFIALGAALIDAFSFTFLVFGLLLVVTAVQLFRHRDQDPSVEDNRVVAIARRVLPLTDEYHEGRLSIRRDGRPTPSRCSASGPSTSSSSQPREGPALRARCAGGRHRVLTRQSSGIRWRAAAGRGSSTTPPRFR
jgi:tellurite resistance protein TerC